MLACPYVGPAGDPASAPTVTAASAELNVLESLMDERWMRSTKIPMPPAIPQAVSRPLSPVRSPNRPRCVFPVRRLWVTVRLPYPWELGFRVPHIQGWSACVIFPRGEGANGRLTKPMEPTSDLSSFCLCVQAQLLQHQLPGR